MINNALASGIFTFLILCSVLCFSQNQMQYEIELGINSSSKPYKGKYGGGKEVGSPLLSPVLGISATRNYSKRIAFTLGLQFYSSGRVFKFKKERYDIINKTSYVVEIKEKVKLTQVAIPLHLKYNFILFSQQMYALAGYSFTQFLNGMHHYKYTVVNSTDIGRNIYSERLFNPFSPSMATPAKRNSGLIAIGFGANVTDRIAVQLTYSTSIMLIEYTEITPPYAYWDDPSYIHIFQRNDFAMTLKYKLQRRN